MSQWAGGAAEASHTQPGRRKAQVPMCPSCARAVTVVRADEQTTCSTKNLAPLGFCRARLQLAARTLIDARGLLPGAHSIPSGWARSRCSLLLLSLS